MLQPASQHKPVDANSHITTGRFVGLWKQSTYSDATIRLISAQPIGVRDTELSEEGTGVQVSKNEGVVYAEVPVHTLVLKEGSTYFKGLLTTGHDMSAKADVDETQRECKRCRVEKALQVFDLTCDSKEDAVAYEAVLEFLYVHQLPASPTPSLLCKMITAADYLGADLCVKACAHSLGNLTIEQHSMLDVCNIMSVVRNYPTLDSAGVTKIQNALLDVLARVRQCPELDPPFMKKLHVALFECILKDYSNVLTIISDINLLFSFCKLPLQSVELWGSSDMLKVDSENSVVVMLNIWWLSQPKCDQTETCMKKLSNLIRPVFLSTGYLKCALGMLDWFEAPFEDYEFASTVIKTVGMADVDMDCQPFDGLNTTKRCGTSQQQLKLERRFTLEQAQQALCSVGSSMKGPQGYWQGHMWSIALKRQQTENGNLELSLVIQKGTAKAMPANIWATAKVTVEEQPFELAWKHTMFSGLQSWFRYETFTEPDVVAALKKYLQSDNQLAITVTIRDVNH